MFVFVRVNWWIVHLTRDSGSTKSHETTRNKKARMFQLDGFASTFLKEISHYS
jgi:hypothetical protein